MNNTNSSGVIELSEQNILDCDKREIPYYFDSVADTLNFVKELGGIQDELSYPYGERQLRCRFQKDKVVMTCKGAVVLPRGEPTLKEVVAKYEPVAVAIDAKSMQFLIYDYGVCISDSCLNQLDDLSHAVLVVGYGTDPLYGDYWIVKNS